jgi:phosphate/sulfate permease
MAFTGRASWHTISATSVVQSCSFSFSLGTSDLEMGIGIIMETIIGFSCRILVKAVLGLFYLIKKVTKFKVLAIIQS